MGVSKMRLIWEDNGPMSELFLVDIVDDIGAFVDVVDFKVEGRVLVTFVRFSLYSSTSSAWKILPFLVDILDEKSFFVDEADIVEVGRRATTFVKLSSQSSISNVRSEWSVS